MEVLAVFPAIAAIFGILSGVEEFRLRRLERKTYEASAAYQAALEFTKDANQISAQLGRNLPSQIDAIDEKPENPLWGFICQHCNLEVGDYKSLRMKADGTVLEISDLLAASHLMACDLKDMRAFYRCLACHLDQRKVDFATSTELEKHTDEHADFSFLPEQLQSAGEKAAERDVEEFMKHDITTYPESTTVTQVAEDPEPQSDPESLETLKASEEFTPSWQELSASHEKATPIQPAPHWAPLTLPRSTKQGKIHDHLAIYMGR
ncbi:hypothetical protein CCHR01_09033 [Colletotrichum chrysophilum]|uniref:Uncharacterized protein n=1 Tax=Colletotrichum chrysophilum TaxID=1836956 RepID=A0AAD9AIM1_9PEZI|nr:hypothetical protein CCHR01_09033 [Colletotrichum chrysophilum]